MEDANVVPPLLTKPPARNAAPIGAVLIDAGRLKIEDAERILRLQREKNLRFGDAAIQLGLLSEDDIAFALASQFDYPYLSSENSTIAPAVMAAHAPFSAQAESLRALRSQLLLRWFDAGPAHKALAIVSAERHEGRSYIAANLAVVFAQLGERTLLIDADLRNPCQHRLFGIENRVGLSAVLAGRAGPDAVQRIPALGRLSVLPAGALPPNPQELLARPQFPQLLQQLAPQIDVVLLDSPATSQAADSLLIAVRASGALIVVRKDSARHWRVKGASETVTQARATIVGAVLNNC